MTDLTQNQLNDAKVVLIGHVGVGKSTLFLRFKEGRFVEDADAQVNMDTLAEHTKELGSGVKVTLLDTAGMEKHLTTLPPTYFREAKAIIYVLAINDRDTFALLNQWVENAEASAPFGCTRAVVGNKIDLESDTVKKEEVKQWAINNDISEDMIFYVSAKTGEGVDDMFKKVAEKIASKDLLSVNAEKITLQNVQPTGTSGGCFTK